MALVRRIGTDLLTWGPYTSFVDREPTTALRILMTSATDLPQRVCDFLEKVLIEERDRGTIAIPDGMSTATVAYAILRLMASFVYADLIAGREPDVEEALQLIALLLPAPG